MATTVFLVDDDEFALRAGGLLLRSRGFAVRTFSCAKECLVAASAQVPDCIVSDLEMPGMDGVELIHSLRSKGFLVPVIIITSAPDTCELIEAAGQAGAHRIFSKQDCTTQLPDAVAEVVGKAVDRGRSVERDAPSSHNGH